MGDQPVSLQKKRSPGAAGSMGGRFEEFQNKDDGWRRWEDCWTVERVNLEGIELGADSSKTVMDDGECSLAFVSYIGI